MHESLLPIGKMAALNRISVSTLRLYDEKGLLKPCYTDPRTGYRYYDINQNARLDMIVYMKELGMSLAEIGQVLQKEDISLIEDILSRKNEQLHQQIRQLKERHDAVERAILSIERYRKSPVTGTFSLEYIDRRYIWGIPCASNFYDDDVHSYENLLRKLRLRLEEEGFAQIHPQNIGKLLLSHLNLQTGIGRLADAQQIQQIAEPDLRRVKFLMDIFKQQKVYIHRVPVHHLLAKSGILFKHV